MKVSFIFKRADLKRSLFRSRMRPLDPTPRHFFNFHEVDLPPFFESLKRRNFLLFASFCHWHLFVVCIFLSFTSFCWLNLVIRLVIRLVWCFPIWLSRSLSYPMVNFSANQFGLFFLKKAPLHYLKHSWQEYVLAILKWTSKNLSEFPFTHIFWE